MNQFDKIREAFSSKTLPKEIRLSKCEYINDVDSFIKSHIKFLENNKHKIWFKPYYLRLVKLYHLL